MADRILVVDDEEAIREALCEFLTDEGYEAILASNGEEALDLAETENPQLILLDMRMPGIDGIETCQRLKKNEKTRLIPIIVATAFRDTFMEACDVGADDFVTKPFEVAELSVRLRSMLHVRHLTNELERAVAYVNKLHENLPKL